jgi:glycosyltransferase involved in cell wall biosynthesis
MEYLNKVLVGDEIVSLANGVLAIGRDAVNRELLPYFPQLEDTRSRAVAGIDEGVNMTPPRAEIDVDAMMTSGGLHRIAADMLGRPTILCVGRISPVKRQCELLAAWASSGWKTHNLVVVGGDTEHPTEDELAGFECFARVVSSRAELVGRFCHLAAAPNEVVRAIQRHFAVRRRKGPHFDVYVCPSLKEEFGLSIVEAMAGGMVVCAPIAGGARNYIRHGVNGFLIDTSSVPALGEEILATVIGGHLVAQQAEAIGRNGAETIRRRYSIESVASEFARYYDRVCAR